MHPLPEPPRVPLRQAIGFKIPCGDSKHTHRTRVVVDAGGKGVLSSGGGSGYPDEECHVRRNPDEDRRLRPNPDEDRRPGGLRSRDSDRGPAWTRSGWAWSRPSA
ncbi:hypothetical protein Pve01_37990 [Planomonospora venezuelensis]|nr:hypothetical protein Pve01_37990 [Planomonospora venezuelensis]